MRYQHQVIEFVAFWSPTYLEVSNNLWKGHLTIPNSYKELRCSCNIPHDSYITYNCISSHDCVPHAIQRCMTYSLYVLVSTPICMPTSQEYHHIKCMYIYTRINTICINNITLHHHDLYASCLGHLSKTFSPLLTGHQLKKKPPWPPEKLFLPKSFKRKTTQDESQWPFCSFGTMPAEPLSVPAPRCGASGSVPFAWVLKNMIRLNNLTLLALVDHHIWFLYS